ELAKSYAGRCATTDEAVATLIAWQSGKAGFAGFVTGCGGAIALPVAMPANLLSTLYIQLRLVAAIAHLRGHELQSAEVRTLALACMTGSKAADTLKDAGIRLGTRLTRDALGWLSPVVVKKVEHAARLPVLNGIATAGAARLGRLVPVVGGVVAGGVDAAVTQQIGVGADFRLVAQFGGSFSGQLQRRRVALRAADRCENSLACLGILVQIALCRRRAEQSDKGGDLRDRDIGVNFLGRFAGDPQLLGEGGGRERLEIGHAGLPAEPAGLCR